MRRIALVLIIILSHYNLLLGQLPQEIEASSERPAQPASEMPIFLIVGILAFVIIGGVYFLFLRKQKD